VPSKKTKKKVKKRSRRRRKKKRKRKIFFWFSSEIIMIKSRRMIWIEFIVTVEEIRNAHKIISGRNRSLLMTSVDGT
jgi:hypothetical protein